MSKTAMTSIRIQDAKKHNSKEELFRKTIFSRTSSVPASPNFSRTSSFKQRPHARSTDTAGSKPLKRSGSLGRSGLKITTPHGPVLATEARSLVRPCGCGKDGTFRSHLHSHQDNIKGNNCGSPKDKKEKPSSKSNKLPPRHDKQDMGSVTGARNKIISNGSIDLVKPHKILPKVVTKTTSLPLHIEQNFAKRYISSVVWYPKLDPKFNSKTFQLAPGEDSSPIIDEFLLREYDSYNKNHMIEDFAEINFGKASEGMISSPKLPKGTPRFLPPAQEENEWTKLA